MKKQTIKRKDGSTVTVYKNDKGEYLCEGYNAESDITKPHSEIICKITDIDLLKEVIEQLEPNPE